ncbi:helix-turn-helix domain-containing protein [Variovorax sp. RA8]|uniref:helix-turn-helix domain-containing protein n=1 Tax=Variovorax sp. (strain JCM 16519 / RA8) TaxID=662548 RepID=UPI000ABD2DB9|nr:helix-turn-helix transcriptional regulator [Variovorax sp. RA8]VTU44912.1 transcriptional regulator, y4mF family [Variovorax sp. RA8]
MKRRSSAAGLTGFIGFDAAWFGACLKQRRLNKSLTLQELAALTGFSVSSISEMENGQKPTFPKAAGVCQALGVRLSRVMLEAEQHADAARAAK